MIHPASAAPPDYSVAAALGMFTLVLGVGGIILYSYLIRQSSAYVVVTGKGYRPQRVNLGKWRWPAFAVVMLYMILKVVLPLGALLYASMLKYYQPPRLHGLPWTLHNYHIVFDYRFFGRYAKNTFVVAVAASIITMFLASIVSWSVVRHPSRLTRLLNVLSFVPLAVPGVISSLAFFLVFVGTSFYGTLTVMVIAFVSRYLAYGTRLMHAAQLQIHKELEEAAETSAVPSWRRYLSINFPLLRPAFVNGLLWVLVHAARDFSVALLLATSSTLLVGNVIYGAFTGGHYEQASAMIMVLVLFNVVVVTFGRRWVTRRGDV
jgi:iron(III) transport system permease protein